MAIHDFQAIVFLNMQRTPSMFLLQYGSYGSEAALIDSASASKRNQNALYRSPASSCLRITSSALGISGVAANKKPSCLSCTLQVYPYSMLFNAGKSIQSQYTLLGFTGRSLNCLRTMTHCKHASRKQSQLMQCNTSICWHM